jgi:hypothetical protein
MGNRASKVATFEDVQRGDALLISVLDDPAVLISGTTPFEGEVAAVEAALAAGQPVVVYGANWSDARVAAKCAQLTSLGGDPRAYVGGMFEWLLLQEYYGRELFGTTGAASAPDLVEFRPRGK